MDDIKHTASVRRVVSTVDITTVIDLPRKASDVGKCCAGVTSDARNPFKPVKWEWAKGSSDKVGIPRYLALIFEGCLS